MYLETVKIMEIIDYKILYAAGTTLKNNLRLALFEEFIYSALKIMYVSNGRFSEQQRMEFSVFESIHLNYFFFIEVMHFICENNDIALH